MLWESWGPSVSLSRDHLHWGKPHDQVILRITSLFVRLRLLNPLILSAFLTFCFPPQHYCSLPIIKRTEQQYETAKVVRKQILHPPPLLPSPASWMFQNNSHSKWVPHRQALNLCSSFSCVANIKLKTARSPVTEINNSGFKCEELANSIQDGGFLDSKYTTTASEVETPTGSCCHFA